MFCLLCVFTTTSVDFGFIWFPTVCRKKLAFRASGNTWAQAGRQIELLVRQAKSEEH